jgi:hypothetical protein
MAKQAVLFDERFLDRYAGAIITDTPTAIVELVANAWDAYATQVEITWPDRPSNTPFSIRDNGKGMTRRMFEKRWRKLDYNREAEEGIVVAPPEELADYPKRAAYGRNGRGRHAALRFASPYRVRTWRDGVAVLYEVRRGLLTAFEIELLEETVDVNGHGTEIFGLEAEAVALASTDAREVIGTRFLFDPNFRVSVDGVVVTFEDVPRYKLKDVDVEVPDLGTVHLTFVDTVRADRTTRQHGIAWRVNARLVGAPSWLGFDSERVLDGRRTEAKRFQVIAEADFLSDSVRPDWGGFEDTESWQATRRAAHDAIGEFLAGHTAERREEAKATVRETLSPQVSALPPLGRDRWNTFVDKVIDSCPSISTDEVQQVAGILANLELSTSKYGLIQRLHDMRPGDLDELHQILTDWNVRTAKLALDEIQARLKLIAELDRKLRDRTMDEVADLQPLFERSLWVFGPEFESIEFTSNRGMTGVIQKLFGSDVRGSRKRPDFVILPDGSVGFYSRDSYDELHEVGGVARVVVAEIKKVGVTISTKEKGQPWEYVKELRAAGLITDATKVSCFVLGSHIDPNEADEDVKAGGSVVIRALSYSTFVKRAEARMLGLRTKLRDAPFLREAGLDTADFIEPAQRDMEFDGASSSSA